MADEKVTDVTQTTPAPDVPPTPAPEGAPTGEDLAKLVAKLKADNDRKEALLVGYQKKENERTQAEKDAAEARKLEEGKHLEVIKEKETALEKLTNELTQYKTKEAERQERRKAEFEAVYEKLSDEAKKLADATEGLPWSKRKMLAESYIETAEHRPGALAFQKPGKQPPDLQAAAAKGRNVHESLANMLAETR